MMNDYQGFMLGLNIGGFIGVVAGGLTILVLDRYFKRDAKVKSGKT
jgi:hypothetical protein